MHSLLCSLREESITRREFVFRNERSERRKYCKRILDKQGRKALLVQPLPSDR